MLLLLLLQVQQVFVPVVLLLRCHMLPCSTLSHVFSLTQAQLAPSRSGFGNPKSADLEESTAATTSLQSFYVLSERHMGYWARESCRCRSPRPAILNSPGVLCR